MHEVKFSSQRCLLLWTTIAKKISLSVASTTTCLWNWARWSVLPTIGRSASTVSWKIVILALFRIRQHRNEVLLVVSIAHEIWLSCRIQHIWPQWRCLPCAPKFLLRFSRQVICFVAIELELLLMFHSGEGGVVGCHRMAERWYGCSKYWLIYFSKSILIEMSMHGFLQFYTNIPGWVTIYWLIRHYTCGQWREHLLGALCKCHLIILIFMFLPF